LENYFLDFKILADAAQLTEADKVINAAQYAPVQEKDVWMSLPEFNATPPNYQKFKEAICTWYLGSTAAEKWTFKDLKELCGEQAKTEITTAAQFAMFDRAFRKIAIMLKKAKLMEDLEMR
jgi:hypothetical protein